VRWMLFERQKGKWDFSQLDAALTAIPAEIEILAPLMSVPAWANGQDPKNCEGWYDTYPPRDLSDWTGFVEKTVGRYRHRIRHWEIWNEENGIDFYRPKPDPVGYTRLLQAAYQAAKRVDPTCVVVLGGLQFNGIIANRWSTLKVENYLEDLYRAGAKPYFDVCNTHPYVLPDDGAEAMMAMLRDSFALMARYGDADKPMWITEFGCGINGNDTAEDQARLLEDAYRLAAAEPRIERFGWFLLRDLRNKVLGLEDSMGLLSLDWEKKPAYHAYRGMARVTAASRPATAPK